MEKLELIKNGISNTVAMIDTVGGAENVILGDYQRNLILRTKGSVRIQVNNKFYDLINNETSTSEENPNTGVIVVNGSIGNLTTIPSDGTLIYTTDPKGLYIVVNGNVVEITDDETGGGSVTGDFISYAVAQTLTPVQIRLAQNNLGLWYGDLAGFSTNSWDKKVSFIESENRHYVNLNGEVVPLYLSTAIGGVVRNGVAVSNSIPLTDMPKALFYVDSLRDNNIVPITDKYEGLFVGNNGFNTGIGINASSQETYINYKPVLNFLNGNQKETLRMEQDTMYIGNGVNDHLLYVKGFQEVDKLTFVESLKSKNAIIVDKNTYFNDNIEPKGTAFTFVDGEIILQVDDFIKTSKNEYRYLKGTGQQLLSDPVRIVNMDASDSTRFSIKTDGYHDFAVGDLILAIADDDDNKTVAMFAGTITDISIPSVDDVDQIISIQTTNDVPLAIRDQISTGHSYIQLVKINNPNILLDSDTNSIIGYSQLDNISDNLYNASSSVRARKYYLKPNNIHTVVGKLANKPDPDFVFQGTEGFYSNNAYIKGKANLNYLKLGDELLYEDGVLNIKDTYRKYGLGVTVAVPHSLTNASGMYGMFETSPLTNVRGSVLRMQSNSPDHQSEIWVSGVTTNGPKMYIRSNRGQLVGNWSKVYTDTDITPQDITNWNTAYNWGQGLPLTVEKGVSLGVGFIGDLDALPKTSFVTTVSSTSTNLPTGATQPGGYLSVQSTSLGFSLLSDRNSNYLGFRSRVGENLGTWRRLWHDADFTTSNINNWNTAYNWGPGLSVNHGSATLSPVTYGGDMNLMPNGSFVAAIAGEATNKPNNNSVMGGFLSIAQNVIGFHLTADRANTGMYFRSFGTQAGQRGNVWRRIWHDGDFTSTNVTNWNTAFSWGNHSNLYPNRAILSPTGNNTVRSSDTRSTNPLPTTDLRTGVMFDFKQSAAIGFNTLTGTSTYAATTTFAPYGDDSGNNQSSYQLAQSGGVLGFRRYNVGSWLPWQKIWTSIDFDPTKFVTLDTEQTISGYKSYTGPSEDLLNSRFYKLKNLRNAVSNVATTPQMIKICLGNPLNSVMWEAVIELYKYTGTTNTTTPYPLTTEVRVTGYNTSNTSPLYNTSARVNGDPGAVTSIKWYKDVNNLMYIAIEGSFVSYPKVLLKELNLHHNITSAIVSSIRANATLEFNTDVTDLTLLRTSTSTGSTGNSTIYYVATQDFVNTTVTNASTLIAVNEGNGIGYRLRASNAANHGNIGVYAIDLSTSNQTGNNGATGSYAAAFGLNNVASGSQSFVAGALNTVSGANSVAFGQNNTVTTQYSMAIGNGNKIDQSSDTSFVLGSSNTIWQGAVGSIVAGTGNLLEAGGMYTIMAGQTNIATQGTGNALIVGRSNTIKTGSNSIFFGSTNEMNGGGSQSLMGGSNNYFGSGFAESIIVGRELTTSSYISESLVVGWKHVLHTQVTQSIIFGNNNQWYGFNGFVGGVRDNLSFGRGGINNTVNATHNTFTFGDSNDNYGRSSTIFGSGLVTNSSLAFTIGVLNDPVIPMTDTSKRDALGKALPAFIVGNGGVTETGWPTYDDGIRSNAYQLLFDGSSTQFGIAAYGGDYSVNFTERSLVDKAYVDNKVNNITTSNDIEITDFNKGVILRGPDNSRWRLTIDSDGGLGATKLT